VLEGLMQQLAFLIKGSHGLLEATCQLWKFPDLLAAPSFIVKQVVFHRALTEQGTRDS
jgi:hypothetical protein